MPNSFEERSRFKSAVWSAALFLGLLGWSEAGAQTFSAIKATQCDVGMTQVPYHYFAHYDQPNDYYGEIHIPRNPYDEPNYLPQMDVTRYVWANAWTKWFDFYVPHFFTE